jgi:plasmid maintenance system antidote protein VapI
MHTTVQLLDLAKQRLAAKHGLELPMSDYRLGKLLNIKQTTISSWRTGRVHIGTEFASRFADACDLSPEYVYACVQRERADTPEEISLLQRIAAAFKETKAAALVLAMVAAGMSLAPAGNQAHASASSIAREVHYAPSRGIQRTGS